MEEILHFEEPKKVPKKLNPKKIALLILILVILIVIITMVVLYNSVKSVRDFLDRYLFQKIVSEEKLVSIPLDYDSNVSVIGYNKYICVLAENILRQYRSSGEIENEIKLEISNPIYHVNDRFLAISEEKGSKIYLISDTKILWEKEVDGNVKRIDVNKNGYVTVILSGTTHKSVIATYDSKGNELFKTYRSSATVLDATISPDNEYLAFAEIDTSGTSMPLNVKIISIEKAEQENPSDYIVCDYKGPSGSIITNIEYQNKNRLVCMYDNSIHIITDNQDEEVMKLDESDKTINSADIRLNNYIYRSVEKSTGLFKTDTAIEMMNIESKKQIVYTVEAVVKKFYCYDNIIAINLGQEVEFINTNGWLIKAYSSSQDIKEITIGSGIAGIIYTDKVEIINL